MVVDRDFRAQSSSQPGEFLFVQNEIVAIRLGVIIRIVLQGITDDVEPIVGDQPRGSRIRPAFQT